MLKDWNLLIPFKLWKSFGNYRAEIRSLAEKHQMTLRLYTHDRTVLDQVPAKAKISIYTRLKPYGRFDSIRNFLGTDNHAMTSIILGITDDDLFIATNTKTLLLAPDWIDGVSQLVEKYGVHIQSPKILFSMIGVLQNQKAWYYRLQLSNKSTLIALSCANDNWATADEQVVIDNFRHALKNGSQAYRDALLFHFLSGVTQSQELRKIEIWAAMPSSKGRPSEILTEFKEHCRYLTGRRLKEDLLIRNSPTRSSHSTNGNYRRTSLDASKHLDTMNINPSYQNKLKGKVVCVIDDYVTNGTTTEAVRALLESAGVTKIIFVSIGRYMRGITGFYKREDYKIDGNVYTTGFHFQQIQIDPTFGRYAEINNSARSEVATIRRILEGDIDG